VPDNTLSKYLEIAPEVVVAIAAGNPVVALESTIISHGMPYPKNVETAASVEAAVRQCGALPATIAVLDGRLKVGLSADEIQTIGELGTDVVKCSRRALPFVVAGKKNGATTVAATMIIAAMAGIRVFATGGIGGVSRSCVRASSRYSISAARSNTSKRKACPLLLTGLTRYPLSMYPAVGFGRSIAWTRLQRRPVR